MQVKRRTATRTEALMSVSSVHSARHIHPISFPWIKTNTIMLAVLEHIEIEVAMTVGRE